MVVFQTTRLPVSMSNLLCEGFSSSCNTWKVDVRKRVSGRGAGCREDIHTLVGDVVTVTKVQLGQWRHMFYDQLQGRICDVQTS